ncbi:MAG: SIMPL domain-containing protein [Leptolyngbyaceae cyanobacterium]
MRVLTVTGQGREQIPTSLATVKLGVEVSGDTAEAAQQAAAEQSSAVVELLRDRQVSQLETTGIRLNPQYRQVNEQNQVVAYLATNTVSFEVPSDAVGPLLDAAVAAGATRIQTVTFKASDEAVTAARDVALQQAVADAQAQADAVLSVLNFTAEEIISIQIGGAQRPTPIPAPRQAQPAKKAAVAASTPVVAGEQTIRATVTLQIRY